MKAILNLTILVFAATQALAAVGSIVQFGPDSKFMGYLTRPEDIADWEGSPPYPGLVVIHEWWGLNDSLKDMADKLASLGYVTLAVDLFGKTTANPAEALKMVRGLNQLSATTQMMSAASYLRTRPYVIPAKVGSIGWCFGGAQSLILAFNDPKLSAAIIYYGQPVTDPGELKKIKAPILGIFGEADTSIPIEIVRAFEKALEKAGVTHEIYTYPNAQHAFASPTVGPNYRAQDAEDAWRKTIAFLNKHLK